MAERVRKKTEARQAWHFPILNTAHQVAIETFVTATLLSRAVSNHLREFGLTLSQHRLLALLTAKEGLATNVIGEALSLSPANLTGVIDRLEKKGLVRRANHGYDRRVNLIQLTAPGRKLEKRVLKVHGGRIQEMMRSSEKDLEELIRLMKKVQEGIRTSGWLGD